MEELFSFRLNPAAHSVRCIGFGTSTTVVSIVEVVL
jgi:hypothetical protein